MLATEGGSSRELGERTGILEGETAVLDGVGNSSRQET